jgi:NAD(P)-dependent dehydrogenase (short-subunit alcohol dehydrogenase family)
VAHAVELSLLKYCGVSAMIERSGCHIIPRLFVNEAEASIWDPLEKKSRALREWAQRVEPNSPRGLALIVGGSRGIGRALAHRLSFLGYGVVTASRSANENELAPRECDRLFLDITHPLSREAFVDLVKSSGVEFSTVIFNAGMLDERARNASEIDFSELRAVFETNVFAVADLNRALLPLVSSKSTLFFISSYMGLPASNDFNYESYRLSKCALSLFARHVGKEMVAQKRDVAVAALHPGSVVTRLNPQGRLSPEESASRIAMLLDETRRSEILARNGEFWMVKEKDDRIDPWTI